MIVFNLNKLNLMIKTIKLFFLLLKEHLSLISTKKGIISFSITYFVLRNSNYAIYLKIKTLFRSFFFYFKNENNDE